MAARRARPSRAKKRGLCLAHEEFFREHQAVRDIAAIQNSDSVRGLTAMKDYLDARVEWMDRALAAGATIGMTSKEVKTLNDTGLLDTVTHRLVEHDPENVELISAVRIESPTACAGRSGIAPSTGSQSLAAGPARSRGGSPTASATWIWPPPASASS